MKDDQRYPTLGKPVTYQIIVPGVLDESWTDWNGEMALVIAKDCYDLPVTILPGDLDQAASQGLLYRLYSLGLPQISVQFKGK